MKYVILESDKSETLAEKVNAAIADGYTVSGPLSVVFIDFTTKYIQAMIKD